MVKVEMELIPPVVAVVVQVSVVVMVDLVVPVS
jgi:hypothetical protein